MPLLEGYACRLQVAVERQVAVEHALDHLCQPMLPGPAPAFPWALHVGWAKQVLQTALAEGRGDEVCECTGGRQRRHSNTLCVRRCCAQQQAMPTFELLHSMGEGSALLVPRRLVQAISKAGRGLADALRARAVSKNW